MNNRTVRSRIIIGFSSLIILMVALCAIGYVQLRRIEAQAAAMRVESIPGLYLINQLHAASISTHSSVQRLVLEQDPAKRQQIF